MNDTREVLTRLILNLRSYAEQLTLETDMATLNVPDILGKLEGISEQCWLAHRVVSDNANTWEGR